MMLFAECSGSKAVRRNLFGGRGAGGAEDGDAPCEGGGWGRGGGGVVDFTMSNSLLPFRNGEKLAGQSELEPNFFFF